MKQHLRWSSSLLLLLLVQHIVMGQRHSPVATLEQPTADSLASVPLRTVLEELGQQYRVTFIFDERTVDRTVPKKTNQKFAEVTDALETILLPLGLSFTEINDRTYVIRPTPDIRQVTRRLPPPTPTTISLEGHVIDQSTGSPLPGVNVVVKGTTVGNVTDAHGYYRLKIPDQATAPVIFSSVGYQAQEVIIGQQTKIDVQLQPEVKALSEVVVVGYGSRARYDMTGAVEFMAAEQLENVSSASFEPLMGGRIAGLQVLQNSGQPGGSVSVRIRGINSINASGEPLYVIDGVPVGGQAVGETVGFAWAGGGEGQTAISALSFLNPHDIASVSILKDASAAAIYGARGANGVVIITTKRGETGSARVRADVSYGWQQTPKQLEVMNLTQYNKYQRELANKGWGTADDPSNDQSLGPGTRWQDEIFRTAPTQNYQLSVDGGGERTRYAVGAGYFQQQGTVVGSGFDRYSFRINLDHRVRKWLKVGHSLILSQTDEQITLNDAGDGIISRAWLTSPRIPARQDDPLTGPPNPVTRALTQKLNVVRNRLLGNVYAEADISPRLHWRTELGGDFTLTDNQATQPPYEWGTTLNEVSQSLRRHKAFSFWILKNYLTYQRSWADRHHVTLLGGQELQETTWRRTETSRKNFSTHQLSEPDGQEIVTSDSWQGSSALVSYFGRLNYDFDDRYLFTATLRADGSSKFGPRNKWGVFPSFALAWKLHQEDFMLGGGLSSVSELKLRAGYGEVGNQDIEDYAYGTSMVGTTTGLGPGYRPTGFANSNVRWESTAQLNLGMDLGLWDNRVRLTADAYHKRIKNMLIQQPLPGYLGTGAISNPWNNRGELENRGFELTLSTINVSRPALSWTTDLAFTYNRNRLVALEGHGAITRNVQWISPVTRTEMGHPLGQFYGYVVDGLFVNGEEIKNSPAQSDREDFYQGAWPGDIRFKNIDERTVDGDGRQVIDNNDRTYIGDPNPDFIFGLVNAWSYQNFDLTMLLRGSYGNDIYNYSRVLTEGMRLPGDNQLATVVYRARPRKIDANGGDDVSNYQLINPAATVPRAVPSDPNGNTRVSDRYVEDGSYLRIQYVTLGYRLPEDLLARCHVQQLRVFATVQNLHTFTRYSGLDPEIGAFNQDPLLQGIDNGHYPTPRTFTLGVHITL